MWFSRAKFILFTALILLVTACQPELSTQPAAPTPVVWKIQITPALRWLGPVFQKCAAENPGFALVVTERSAAEPQPEPAPFSFQWGERSAAAYTAELATEELAVIVHPSNPIENLSVDAFLGLYSTQAERWKAACPTCPSGLDGLLQTYAYAPGEDIQSAAAWIQAGPRTRLAPGPEEVRQAVAKDPYAIGFVPAHWVDHTIKRVRLDGTPPGSLRQPILVSAAAEPQGSQRSWLICVQETVR
jgi:hypothetical protein